MKSFADLFAGRDDIAGRYELPAGVKPTQKGKLAGRAQTLREAITEADYQKHTAGKRRLGIVPIRPRDNTISWFALDADVYNSPGLHAEIVRKINRAMLPLCVTKSKSGGAHIWCFFRDPVPAGRGIDIAKAYLKKLGLDPKTEIFPKQATINEADDGSWINLPYFGKTCRGIADDGETELALDDFLAHANGRLVTLEDAQTAKKNAEVQTSDAPPCVEVLLREGMEEGGRNDAMTQIAVYLRKSGDEAWEDTLNEINQEKCYPPISTDEMKNIIKSIKRKNYQYLCNHQPMCSLCDKKACVQRKYGVGTGEASTGSAVIIVDELIKIDGDQPTYRVTMYGKTFELPTIEHLTNFKKFQNEVAKRTQKMIGGTTQKNWEGQVAELLDSCREIEAPKDTVMAERIHREFCEWVKNCCSQEKPDVIVEGGQVYYDTKSKLLYFRGHDFLEICERKFKVPLVTIWKHMHDKGAEEAKLRIGNVMHDVWSMPLTDERLLGGREQV